MSRPIFLLVDGHALIYRAFYALPKLSDPQGRVVNAVYGFARVLLSAIQDFEPEYLAVTFDHPSPTFRHKEYKEYKAQRPKMPDELQPQIPLIKELVEKLNIPQYEQIGYEADDLIGTISHKLDCRPEDLDAPENLLTVVVTGDKDLLQLVDNNTHVWLPKRGRKPDREYDQGAVEEDMGVRPDQVVDLKALMGDSSDNIPGIKGIGPKTAIKLLDRYSSLEELYQAVSLIKEEKQALLKGNLLKKLVSGKDKAFLSQKLARLDQEVPLKIDLKHCRVESYNKIKAVEFLKELDFTSLVPMLPNDRFEAVVQEALL